MKKFILILILIFAIVGASGCIDSDTGGNSIDVYVVASDSMEPALYEGDMVVAEENPDNIEVGDIVIYNATWHPNPIIHRVISIQEDSNGNTLYEMKGDNNSVSDPELVYRSQITAKVIVTIPQAGNIALE